MKNIDFSQKKFRCHNIYSLLTNPPGLSEAEQRDFLKLSKKLDENGKLAPTDNERLSKIFAKKNAPDTLPEGAKTFLQEEFNADYYGIRQVIYTPAIGKGLDEEPKGIRELSKLVGIEFQKNKEIGEDEYQTGECDILVRDLDLIIDIKLSENKKSFDNCEATLTNIRQIQSYGQIYGANKLKVVYMLVNSPAKTILDEKNRLFYQMGAPTAGLDDHYEKYIEKCKQIERNHIYDIDTFLEDNPGAELESDYFEFENIPLERRVKIFDVEPFTKEELEFRNNRIKLARKHLQKLKEKEEAKTIEKWI